MVSVSSDNSQGGGQVLVEPLGLLNINMSTSSFAGPLKEEVVDLLHMIILTHQ